jgi:hypothetical protein
METAYWVGDVVYHRCAKEEKPGIVTSVSFLPAGVIYRCSFAAGDSSHYEIELAREFVPDYVKDAKEAKE